MRQVSDLFVDQNVLTFFIPGTPKPQGSKKVYNGVLVEASAGLKDWRYAITLFARKARGRSKDWPATGPVAVTAHFRFQRPKSHFGTGRNEGKVKASAPTWFTNTPDLDKLMRALGDGLKDGGIVRDDSLIVAEHIYKVYDITDPGVFVVVTKLNRKEDDERSADSSENRTG